MLFLERVTIHQNGRPIFYVDNNNPCLGSGVIMYVKHKGQIFFLIQEEDNNKKYRFCDLGGKTDLCDKNIIETAIREVMEETNGVLFSSLFRQTMKNLFSFQSSFSDYMKNFYRIFEEQEPQFIYSNKSKYLIVMLELNSKYLDPSLMPKLGKKTTELNQQFGTSEEGNALSRKIIWMEMGYFNELLRDKKMHIRLKDSKMYKQLEKLYKY